MTSFEVPVLPMPSNGYTNLGAGMLLVTQMWGDDLPDLQTMEFGHRPIVQYEEPSSIQDAQAGGFCERTHFWFPGHALVDINGRRVGAPFARRDPQN